MLFPDSKFPKENENIKTNRTSDFCEIEDYIFMNTSSNLATEPCRTNMVKSTPFMPTQLMGTSATNIRLKPNDGGSNINPGVGTTSARSQAPTSSHKKNTSIGNLNRAYKNMSYFDKKSDEGENIKGILLPDSHRTILENERNNESLKVIDVRASHSGELTLVKSGNISARELFFKDCNVNKNIKLNFDMISPIVQKSEPTRLSDVKIQNSSSKNYIPNIDICESFRYCDSTDPKHNIHQDLQIRALGSRPLLDSENKTSSIKQPLKENLSINKLRTDAQLNNIVYRKAVVPNSGDIKMDIAFDNIDINRFKVEKTIGQGSYATVKLAYDSGVNGQFAIKIYDKYKLLDPHKLNNVKREIIILRKIDHPNIIKFYYAVEDKRQIHLVMEYVGSTSLNNYIKLKMGRRLDEKESRRIFSQIAKGISYCHAKNIVHRDIKLENILLDEQNDVKLIDFGFSIIKQPNKKLNIFCGTPSYMAPEIVSKSQYSGPEADVWAMGIVLYLMLCGYFPFKGLDEKDLYKKIIKGSFDLPDHLSEGAKKLLKRLLANAPSDRISAEEVLQDPWLAAR